MEDFSQVIIDSVQRKVEEKIPAFIFGKIREAVLDVINEYLQREIPLALEQMVSELSVLFEKRIKPAEIIRDKLNAFSLEQFERLVLQVARQELKHIEYLGGVLGFLIGIGQALVLSFL
jgi:uncharacterized membrane protein YheB (UPF0754 family)